MGDTLRMVAGRGRDDPGFALLIREGKNPVQRSSILERAGLLQVLELQVELATGQQAEFFAVGTGRQQHIAGDTPARKFDLVDADHARNSLRFCTMSMIVNILIIKSDREEPLGSQFPICR